MGALTAEQKKFYADNGYIVLDLLTKQETDNISKEYDLIFERKADSDLETSWQGNWEKSKEHNVWDISTISYEYIIFTNTHVLRGCK